MVRNRAKPFIIAGFILGEIYMLFTTLGGYGRETHPLPMPIPAETRVQPGTPAPTDARFTRALIAAIFFGPFGAVAGLGVGLLYSGVMSRFEARRSDALHSGEDCLPPR